MTKIETYFVRWFRIVKHTIQSVLTNNIEHKYEVYHYYYMKRFKNYG